MDPLSMLTGREKAVKAVKINNIELLERLLRKDGVDAFHRKVGYPQPDSATLAAAEMGRVEILKLFHSQHDGRSNDMPQVTDPVVMLAACVGLSVDSISYLIELGMDANTAFPQGHRPLHAVVKCGITRCDGSFRALMGQFKRREIYQRTNRTTPGVENTTSHTERSTDRSPNGSINRTTGRPIHVTNGMAGEIQYTRRRSGTTDRDLRSNTAVDRDPHTHNTSYEVTVSSSNSRRLSTPHDGWHGNTAGPMNDARAHTDARVFKSIPLLTKCQFNCHYDRICTCRRDRHGHWVNKTRTRKSNNRGCRHRIPYTTMASVKAHHCSDTDGHETRRLQCLVRLVKLGADPALRDGYGCTPLHYSVWCGMVHETLFLLSVAPQLLHMADDRGNTPLHYAAFIGNEEIICHLLKIGANLNAANMWGETPLHLTVTSHCAPALRLLLRWGGNVTLRMEDGKRPLDLARAVGFAEGVKELSIHSCVPTLKRLAMQRATVVYSSSIRPVGADKQLKVGDVDDIREGFMNSQSELLCLLVGSEDLGDVFDFGVECCQCCINIESNHRNT